MVDRSSVPDDTEKSSVYAGLRTFEKNQETKKSKYMVPEAFS